MFSTRTSAAAVAISTAALLVFGALPAFADGNSYYYSVTMPIGQAPRNTGPQTKTVASRSGQISSYSVSGGFKIDAQMCSNSGLYCGGGTKVYKIPDSGSYALKNSYGKGKNIAINIQPSTWNGGDVTATGYSGVG